GTELVPSTTPVTGALTLGDINQDGVVNVKDISALMSALGDLSDYQAGTAVRSGSAWTASQLMNVADTNLDDVVDNRDIQGLITYLANGLSFPGGGSGGIHVVPEPASVVLLAIGGIALLIGGVRRNRRTLRQ